jgi:hypothetical protein
MAKNVLPEPAGPEIVARLKRSISANTLYCERVASNILSLSSVIFLDKFIGIFHDGAWNFRKAFIPSWPGPFL